MVREHMGPVAAFRLAVGVKALPTTRSGKICRKSIADLARNKLKKVLLFDSGKGFVLYLWNFQIPGTVLDPTVYKEIEEVLRKLGFCSS